MQLYDPKNPKMLGAWFDPHSSQHCRAYRELEKVGFWPTWFQKMMDEAEVIDHQGWQVIIVSKMATAWLKYKEAEDAE